MKLRRTHAEILAIALAMIAAPCEFLFQQANERASAFVQRVDSLSGDITSQLVIMEIGTIVTSFTKGMSVDPTVLGKDQYLMDEVKDRDLKRFYLIQERDFADVVIRSIRMMLIASDYPENLLSCSEQWNSSFDEFYRHTGLRDSDGFNQLSDESTQWGKINFDYVAKSKQIQKKILHNGSTCLTEARLKTESDALFWRYIAIAFLVLAAFTSLAAKVIELREYKETD